MWSLLLTLLPLWYHLPCDPPWKQAIAGTIFLSLQNCELNKPLFFIKYPALVFCYSNTKQTYGVSHSIQECIREQGSHESFDISLPEHRVSARGFLYPMKYVPFRVPVSLAKIFKETMGTCQKTSGVSMGRHIHEVPPPNISSLSLVPGPLLSQLLLPTPLPTPPCQSWELWGW
jgi:hypothetical protein